MNHAALFLMAQRTHPTETEPIQPEIQTAPSSFSRLMGTAMADADAAAERYLEEQLMKAFCIDTENNITALAARGQAPKGTEVFSTKPEFAEMARGWPMARLVEVWNSFAGAPPFGDLKPVKKFENQAKAVRRIWDAIQKLEAPVLEKAVETPAPTPEEIPTAAPKLPRVASKARKPRKEAATGDAGAVTGKKAEIIALISRSEGATLQEIMTATGWQAHSVRGFIAGTLGTKMGLEVESFKNEAKERTYRLGSGVRAAS